MEIKVEKWLEERSQNIKEEWKDIIKARISKCESPMEKLFLIEWGYQTELYSDFENFFIIPQYKLSNYRVDFLIYYYRDGYRYKEKSLIVEIDGYLWHGSEPEQFAKEKERERKLQKEGYNLMRFSGREIYRNIEKCVTEVIEVLLAIEKHELEKELEEYEKNKG